MAGSADSTSATVILRLPASPAHVRTARLVAAAMARRSGVEEGLLDEVRLAVGEACARAVRQHERHGVHEPVTVEFIDRGKFGVAVIDRAPVANQQPDTPSPSPADAGPRSASSAGTEPAAAGGDGGRGQLDEPGGAALSGRPAAGEPIAVSPGALHDGNLNATADTLGLALLGAVVQDLAVTPAEAGTGTRVSMSWPLED